MKISNAALFIGKEGWRFLGLEELALGYGWGWRWAIEVCDRE